jgi:lycopene cyclase domain-containing protein
MYVYLIFLLFFYGAPTAVLVFLAKDHLLKYRRVLLWSLGFVFTLGWVWDWLSVRTGVWRYDTADTLGVWIGGLPVEEFVGFYVLSTLFMVGIILLVLGRFERVKRP